MKINRFFETVLKAPPKSLRWSWGAADHTNKRVFLRVWGDSRSLDTKRNRILILDRAGHDFDSGSHLGFKERESHITLQANGYCLYVIV